MNCSTPVFLVLHYLLEFAQTHIHWVQWCHPTILSYITPSSSCSQSFPASESFPMSRLFTSGGQSITLTILTIQFSIKFIGMLCNHHHDPLPRTFSSILNSNSVSLNSLSARAAITKYHTVGGLNNMRLFSHSSEDWKSKIMVPASSGSGGGSLPDLQTAALLLYPHMVERVLRSLPSLIRPLIPSMGPHSPDLI